MGIRIHPTAKVSDKAQVGGGAGIWHHAQVCEGAKIGDCGAAVVMVVYSTYRNLDLARIKSVFHLPILVDGRHAYDAVRVDQVD